MLGSTEPQRFRDWIARQFGLNFDEGKLEYLADVLSRRADEAGVPPSRYLDRLDASQSDPEVKALAVELTVPESYFFRHFDQFRAFSEVALPDALAARASSRTIAVLSAGCASGEEPYSLAILMRERALEPGWKAAIRAVDVNPAMLAKAARGMYSAWALRETPPAVRQRWFRDVGREFAIDEAIRGAVSFQELNLAAEGEESWRQTYDVIFCRNVIMYFTPAGAQALIARLTRSLVPGGHLFLGHAETLRGMSNDFHLCHTHGTFYYRRKEVRQGEHHDVDAGPSRGALDGVSPSWGGPAGTFATPAADVSWTKTWLETIQQASNRIQALTERPAAAPAAGRGAASGAVAQTATQLQLVLDLLKQERFSDALDLLGRLPAASASDADVMLLRAALLTHSGQLSAAEQASRQLLERDELNTGAHYLLALCRESAGDPRGAQEHDRTAAYLDPSFAMPRLHLGLMARRAGDGDNAHRELEQALLLLKREDSSRLLLFGGGFGREALIALCRAELESSGGLP